MKSFGFCFRFFSFQKQCLFWGGFLEYARISGKTRIFLPVELRWIHKSARLVNKIVPSIIWKKRIRINVLENNLLLWKFSTLKICRSWNGKPLPINCGIGLNVHTYIYTHIHTYVYCWWIKTNISYLSTKYRF